MKAVFEIHPIQAKIIQGLLFSPDAKFSELNKDKLPTDQFNFHLKALVASGLLTKTSGRYQLTTIGKEFANRFDSEKAQVEKQGKICVVVHSVKRVGKVKKYLLQERLKHPFYGYWGPAGGKVRWGETAEEAAKREFKEETGYDANVKLLRIKHKMDYSKDGLLIDDKIFLVFRAYISSGTLKNKFDGGQNMWLTLEEIQKLPLVYDDFDKSMQGVDQKSLTFTENKYTVSGF